MGAMLMMVADTYPQLHDFLLEIIQNSIDESPKHINVKIDFKRRAVTVTDDGNGASRARFDKALQQIGQTMKTDDKLGRFGRGLIAPLGKCESFTFTSCPIDEQHVGGYRRWTFITEDICNQADVEVPCESLPDFRFTTKLPRKHNNGTSWVAWRTMVSVKKITKDRFVSRFNFDEFLQDVADRFGIAIKKSGIQIEITFINSENVVSIQKVKPIDFNGDKLDCPDIYKSDSGRVVFNLFVALRTANGRKGVVKFGELGDDFRLTGQQIAMSIRSSDAAGLIDNDVINALNSGIFEGEILAENIRLSPSRKSFERNDAFLDFLDALSEWYDTVGKGYIDNAKDERKDNRYRLLLARSLKVVEAMIKRKDSLKPIFENMKNGTIGSGHSPVKTFGQQDVMSNSIHGGVDKERVPTGDHPGSHSSAQRPQQNHLPITRVVGKKGSKRWIVKSDSLGIQVVLEELPGSSRVYTFNTETGVLVINVRHIYWMDCEDKDSTLMKYIETVAIIAFTLAQYPNDTWYSYREEAVLDSLELLVFNIKNADLLSKRQHGKKAQK